MNTGNGIWAEVDELIALKAFSGNIFRRSDKKSSSPLSGGYSSPFRGRGIDFSEVRPYLPGDDIRSMDWRVTARTGKPHTKLFIEERERPVFFLCDYSSSMYFATRTAFKSVVVSKLVSLLAWAASGHGDRVGGFLFNENDLTQLKPMGGMRGVLRLINEMSKWSKELPDQYAQRHTDFFSILKRAKTIIRPGSLVYFVSDFRAMSANAEKIFAELARHCDVVLIQVSDPSEQHISGEGQLRISDGEQFGTVDVTNKQVKQRIVEQLQRRQEKFDSFCLTHGIHSLVCSTVDDIAETLRSGLSHRQRLTRPLSHE